MPQISFVTLVMTFKPLFPALLLSLYKQVTNVPFLLLEQLFPPQCPGQLVEGGGMLGAGRRPREQDTNRSWLS